MTAPSALESVVEVEGEDEDEAEYDSEVDDDDDIDEYGLVGKTEAERAARAAKKRK